MVLRSSWNSSQVCGASPFCALVATILIYEANHSTSGLILPEKYSHAVDARELEFFGSKMNKKYGALKVWPFQLHT